MPPQDEQITVTRNDEAGRYEVTVDGAIAGFTVFEIDDDGRAVYPHTVVDPAFGGRGLCSVLVSAALADEAARGTTIVPLCPFVVRYLERTEVAGLVIAWPEVRS